MEEGEEARVYRPKTFSETKFANYCSEVYRRFREIVPSLLVTMEEVKVEFSSSGDSSQGEKARKADTLMGKIYNATFLLSLSALVDVYRVYSVISTNFQVVDRMPFDRKDVFDSKVKELDFMKDSAQVESCACSVFFDYEDKAYTTAKEWGAEEEDWTVEEIEFVINEVCGWRTLHGDIREVACRGLYRGIFIGCLAEEGSKTRAGTGENRRNLLLDVEKVTKVVTQRGQEVAQFLHKGLSEKVYSSSDIQIIENIRKLLDLKTLSKFVLQHGASNTSSMRWRGFRDASQFLFHDLFVKLPEDELRLQYREFVVRVEQLGPSVKDMANTAIFDIFLDPTKGLYR